MNKLKKIILLFFLVSALFACKDNVTTAGTSVLSSVDDILVNTDTFNLQSQLFQFDYIYSSPDSFLIGEADTKFGTLHAELLTQLACPLDYKYPEGAEVDSAFIYMYYRSWWGDGSSPLSIAAYEMDKGTFSYTEPYGTNINISDYCSKSDEVYMLQQPRIILASKPTDSVYSNSESRYVPYIRLQLNDEYAQKIFSLNEFSSQNAFNEQFHGICITSDFGAATILNVLQVTLDVHYHYSYMKAGVDTTVSSVKTFYANSEVRQVNRVEYSDLKYDELAKENDSVNYIISPAGMITRISFPMSAMAERITDYLHTNSPDVEKRPYVNRALLTIDVLYEHKAESKKTRDDWYQPASDMMLIKEDAALSFFENKDLPSDTCAMVATLESGTDSLGNTVYYYLFNMAELLTRQLRVENQPDTLHMVLIPITATKVTNGSYVVYSSIKPMQTISATTIKSAQAENENMDIEVVYSGF